jgi:hypothetical protein
MIKVIIDAVTAHLKEFLAAGDAETRPILGP